MAHRNRHQRQNDAALRRLQTARHVHRHILMHDLGLGLRDDNAFVRRMGEIKDEAVALGLHVVPVMERLSWWTAYPSDITALRQLIAVSLRQQTERNRNARVMTGLQWAGPFAAYQAAHIAGEHQALQQFADQLHRQHMDTVVQRIDQLVAMGRNCGP